MSKTREKTTPLILTMAILCGLSSASYAEDSPQDFTLETIVVTDSRIVGEGETTKVTSLNVKDKIDAGQIKSVTDLLRDVPGVIVNSDPLYGTTVSMRGMDNARILVAINGNVIENQGGLYSQRGLDWNSLPVNNIKKIEIIRGGSSVQYGGTWGGVINIVTVESPGENKTYLKYSLGSNDDKKYSVSNQGTSEDGKFSWTINANKRKSDGFYRNNFLDSEDINLNLSYKLADKKKVSFAWTDSQRKEGVLVGNNQKSNNQNGWDSSYPETPVTPHVDATAGYQYLDGSYRKYDATNFSVNYDDEDWKLGVYKNKQVRKDWLREQNQIEEPELKTDNRGYSWQQSKQIQNHKLLYGVDYRNMKFDISSKNFNTAMEGKMNGYFLQDNWQVTKKALVGLGLRYDQYKAEDHLMNTELTNEFQLSPKVNMTYQLTPQEAVYASASKIFRSPVVTDYSRWFSNYYDTSSAKNRNKYSKDKYGDSETLTLAEWQKLIGPLKPESGMAYEIGWKKQFNAKFNGQITGFYNDINDYVNTYMGSGITAGPPTYNIDNAKIKGVEIATDYQFNHHLGLVLNYTTQTAAKSGDRLDPEGILDLTDIPQKTINLGLYYNNQKGFQASLNGRYRSEKKVDTNTTLGGHTLVDVACAYSRNNSTIALAVNNIFDKDYQEISGLEMQGTTYNLSYQLAF